MARKETRAARDIRRDYEDVHQERLHLEKLAQAPAGDPGLAGVEATAAAREAERLAEREEAIAREYFNATGEGLP